MNSKAFFRLIICRLGDLSVLIRRFYRERQYSTVVRRDHLVGGILLLSCSAFLLGRLLDGAGTVVEYREIPASYNANAAITSGLSTEDLDDSAREMARTLGRLCARIARLESVGVELLTLADMREGEFSLEPGACLDAQSDPEAHSLLNSRIDHIETELDAMLVTFAARRSARLAWPSGTPLYNATAEAITSRFGVRRSVLGSGSSYHHGLDLGAPYGSAVLAMGSGVVTFAGKNGNYGNLVEIDHGNGFVSRYGHNSENLVSTGVAVKRGQMIARVGSSGRSTGPHVHVEVRSHGKAIDPLLTLRLPKG